MFCGLVYVLVLGVWGDASGYGCLLHLSGVVPPLPRAIVQQKHMLCTLSQGTFDVRSDIGVEFYRCKIKDSVGTT